MKKNPDFIIIPHQLILDKNLQPLDRILYGVIYWLVHLRGEKCTASNATLKELCGVKSKSAIVHSLIRLENGGYILRRFYDENKKQREEIIPLVRFRDGTNVPSVGTNVPWGDSTNVLQNNKSIIIKDNNILPKGKEKISNSSYGNQDINELILLLKEKNFNLLDGSERENRRYCWVLLKKLGYDKDKEKAKNGVRAIIEFAAQSNFHAKNATSFKYLYKHAAAIIRDYKKRSQDKKVITI